MGAWLSAGALPATRDPTCVIDRQTGDTVVEKVPWKITLQLGLLHSTWLGSWLADTWLLRSYLLAHSRACGRKYDDPASRQLIPEYIKAYGIDTSELEGTLDSYRTLNEFFYRKLRAGARPVAQRSNPQVAVQPADARVQAFCHWRQAAQLWIKGRGFTLQRLLGPGYAAAEWDDAPLLVARLAPTDYHRFHSPVDGTLRQITRLGADLYSVKPVAILSSVDVFGRNIRMVLELATAAFGTVLVVVVGATQVGSITLTRSLGESVAKGDELGYFAYGGSSLVLVFRPGAITFDSDLLRNTERGCEALVKLGQTLGVAVQR